MRFSAREAASAIGGKLVGPDRDCEGASIDSRSIREGQLFFAIRGERDGHRFVVAALEAGAAGAVVERDIEMPSLPDNRTPFFIRTDDTQAALSGLARHLRLECGAEVVAITGSVGKTTTREIAKHAIGAERTVFQSPGNWNNHLGVPLSVLAAGDEDIWVMELAMSAPGEIRELTRIVTPDCGLITAISPAHLEGLGGGLEAVAAAKGELFETLPADATALVRADDERVVAQAERFPGHRITFGFRKKADIRGRRYRKTEEGLAFEARAFGGPWTPVRCRLPGTHNAQNALAGIAAAVAMGVPLGKAAEAIEPVGPLPGRGERITLAGGATALDETYNSSPAALRAAIADFAVTPARRRILVAGDMCELGAKEGRFHAECGEYAASVQLDMVIGVGALGRRLAEAAKGAGVPASGFETPDEAAEALSGELREGDLVLFKASRAVGLERTLEKLGPAGEQGV